LNKFSLTADVWNVVLRFCSCLKQEQQELGMFIAPQNLPRCSLLDRNHLFPCGKRRKKELRFH